MKQVEKQVSENNSDYVDEHIEKEAGIEKEKKLCIECGSVKDVSYRYCWVCGGALQKANPPDVKDNAAAKEKLENVIAFNTDIPIQPNTAKVHTWGLGSRTSLILTHTKLLQLSCTTLVNVPVSDAMAEKSANGCS